MLPNFRAQEVSTTEANTWDIQATLPQPTNFLYDVELAATSQAELNALVTYVLSNMPQAGFGMSLSVSGKDVNYHGTSARDQTNYKSKDGRFYRYCFEYTVEGWLVQSLACEQVGQVLTVKTEVDVYDPRVPLHTTPPPVGALADAVEEIDVP
jgi:hypothetical protein